MLFEWKLIIRYRTTMKVNDESVIKQELQSICMTLKALYWSSFFLITLRMSLASVAKERGKYISLFPLFENNIPT